MVKRNISTYTLTDQRTFYTKMLNWANQFNIFCLLHSNHTPNSHYDWIMAVQQHQLIAANTNCLTALQQLNNIGDWIFGHISYDLKNELNQQPYTNTNVTAFTTIAFFQPVTVLYYKNNVLTIETLETTGDTIFSDINNYATVTPIKCNVSIKATETKESYIATINRLKAHIQRGDCYEINYCTSFFDTAAYINPIHTFQQLQSLSPTPFTAFYKNNSAYLICASPERYICKVGNTLLSEPIKGTIKRDLVSTENDALLQEHLRNNKKEQSEHIMTVDLVRNDLSIVCNNVSVVDLLRIKSFPQVHHLVSTIKGTLKHNTTFAQIIEATFPMGSMTGAPKQKVMELIDKYEAKPRGLFSGTVGYIAPNGDFDFNVVIRSILYNDAKKYLQYWVGSGITTYCIAEQEYEECLLKAKAIETVLS